MNEEFVPKINCRFRIRKDINGYIGFFQGKGVLTFNEIGAFIVNCMTGEDNVKKIGQLVVNTFPQVENPISEIMSIVNQLQASDFFEYINRPR